VDKGAGTPTIDTKFFNCPPSHFWSASANAYNPHNAWLVHFSLGNANGYGKYLAFHARLVRGGQ
jgi:hypothetical protein